MSTLVILAETPELIESLIKDNPDKDIIVANDKLDNKDILLCCSQLPEKVKVLKIPVTITSFHMLEDIITARYGIKDFNICSSSKSELREMQQRVEGSDWLPYPFTKEQWNMPGIKLHLGCGTIYLNDFVNVDIDNPVADENFDAFKLKYKDNSVAVILASHIIEHFKWQDHLPLLTEWRRVLKHGGWLIIECPDLEKGCKHFLETESTVDRLGVVFPQMFGRPDFSVGNVHLSGIWPSYLLDLFKAAGFTTAVPMEPIANNIRNRCMRIDAKK